MDQITSRPYMVVNVRNRIAPNLLRVRKLTQDLKIAALIALIAGRTVQAQTAVPVGGGSYASTVPTDQYGQDEYYGLGVDQIIGYYNLLHLDPSKQGSPIPTNHWWTDALIADRSFIPANGTTRTIVQDRFGGQLWFYPGMVQPQSYGLDVYFPNSWVAGNGSTPQGNFDPGPVMRVAGTLDPTVGSDDILLANFEGSSYPAGWTTTGDAFGNGPVVGGTWPGQSPPVSGYLGSACVNSYNGSNAGTGTLVSPVFTISKHYIAFLVGGGNDIDHEYVGLVVNGSTVLKATGQQDATLRWVVWDVSAYSGQSAQIEIVDSSTGGWGFILADFLVETDNGGGPSLRYTSTFAGQNTVVTSWGDWSVDFKLADTLGNSVATTLTRGTPFIWTKWSGSVMPSIPVGSGNPAYEINGTAIDTSSGSFTASSFAFDYSGRTYGIFLPANTMVKVTGGNFVPQLSAANNYMVIAFLPDKTHLGEFSSYAYAHPTNSVLTWNYRPSTGTVSTTHTLTTESWQYGQTTTLMGWLPHHYRTTTNRLAFKPYEYLTPRGTMKIAPGNTGTLTYNFHGIVPLLPAPKLNGLRNDYDVNRMNRYINNYQPASSTDTYWGGKDLALTAQYVGFADQLQNPNFDQLKADVESELGNWFTYTPGETAKFFARVPNWGSMFGFQASYGSQAFSDNHFHYGYFTLATALVGMSDHSFINQYGPMARLVAKQYANWDRTDTSFPFLRTFDAWEGHSNAGGTSSPGGENQESSSEAVNSWVGLFLLGAQLNDSNMMAAGAMGYAVETASVNEYWQNMYGTNFPPGYYVYGDKTSGGGIVGSGGVAYGTFFTGDPAWIYGIQNTPPNHWNNYLVRGNKAFAQNQLNGMYSERSQVSAANTGTNNGGFTLNGATNDPPGMGEGLGNVILEWQTMFDPNTVASLMDQYYASGETVATAPSNPGVTYYLTHALRGLGDPDPTYYTDMPTSAVYFNHSTGQHNWIIYNYLPTTQAVHIYNGTNLAATVFVLPRTLRTNFEYGPSLSGINLAKGKPATVSSVEGAGLSGSNAVDGNVNTQWSSQFSDPQWIYVDLGAIYNISEIRLNWGTNCGKNYQLQVSNDATNWTTVQTVTNNTTAGLLDYPGLHASGRYVRMYGETRATQAGYSLAEFEVYGQGDTDIALNRPASTSSVTNGNVAANAVDGNTGTRWESAYSDPQWISVDLGATHIIHAVNLDWEAACGRDYLIQVSDNGFNWTTVQTVTNNTTSGWLRYPGLNTSGRYVRVYGTARATQWGYSLWELQVEGQ
jgi:endoglucanase Acf2